MRVKVKTQFFIRKSVPSADGKLPIYFRMRCNYQLVEIATGRGINLKDWDRLLRRSKANNEEAYILNNFLDDIENDIRRYINYLVSVYKVGHFLRWTCRKIFPRVFIVHNTTSVFAFSQLWGLFLSGLARFCLFFYQIPAF